MIIKRSTYDAALDLINEQRHTIELQRKEISQLQKRIDFLSTRHMLKEMYFNIDFPNSQKGGFEGSDIFTM